jgi:hypothetical protein
MSAEQPMNGLCRTGAVWRELGMVLVHQTNQTILAVEGVSCPAAEEDDL